MAERSPLRRYVLAACLSGMLIAGQAQAQRGPADEPEAWFDDPRRKTLTGEIGRAHV